MSFESATELARLVARAQSEALPVGELQKLVLTATEARGCGGYVDELRGILRRHRDVLLESAKGICERATAEKRPTLLASESRQVEAKRADAKAITDLMQMVDAAEREHNYVPDTQRWNSRSEAETRTWLPTLAEYRAMGSTGTDALGGYLVPEQQSALFFDRLRAQTIVFNLPGINVLSMNSLEMNVPGLSGSATAAMVAENTEITDSDLTLTSRKLTAKKLAAYVLASNEVLADSNPALRNLVAMDLIKTMAQELDRQMLEGAGAGSDLTGIRRWVGPTNTVLGSGSGAVITLDNIAGAIGRMKINNANPGAILMHPRTEAQVRLLKDGDGHYIWQPSLASDGPARLFGLPIFVSSQVSVIENVGGATKSWLAVVDPTQLVIGRRLDVAVFYDPYSRAKYDQVAIRATARFDFAVLNSAGIEIISALSAS